MSSLKSSVHYIDDTKEKVTQHCGENEETGESQWEGESRQDKLNSIKLLAI